MRRLRLGDASGTRRRRHRGLAVTAAVSQRLAALGATIRELREERSLSAVDLAEVARVDVTQLVDLENGRVDPRFDFLLTLAGGLSVAGEPTTVAEIVTRAEGRTA